jgi:uracil-DNA glycosylase
MATISTLINAVEREAAQTEFPIDKAVYEKAGKDPLRPILFAGALEAPVCFLGRDLGKDEVAMGQPLIGAAGRLVRAGVYKVQTGTPPSATDRTLESVLPWVLLTNLVPYKPPGNKAYAPKVRERFRPYLAALLAVHWQGDRVITLGTESFQWFAPYIDPAAFADFWRRDDRYEATLTCELSAAAEQPSDHPSRHKTLYIMPLPHPSPLNQRWYKQFPDLLERRLAAVKPSRS